MKIRRHGDLPSWRMCFVSLFVTAVTTLLGRASAVKVHTSQQDVLLKVLGALKPLDSALKQTWNVTKNCSSWAGVTCDNAGLVIQLVLVGKDLLHPNGSVLVNRTLEIGVDGDKSGHVLTGILLGDISQLTSLKFLALHGIGLEGTIPPNIGELTSLQILDLGRNDFNGAIPESLGNLTELLYLDVSSNGFTGSFDDFLGNFTRIESLFLGNTSLNGIFPTIVTNYTSLKTLNIFRGGLSDAIPDAISNLVRLENLDLSDNRITSIPADLSMLVSLATLNLAGNLLTAFRPLATLPSLINLNASANLFDGTSSGPYLANLTKLTRLDLSNNDFSGGIPVELTTMRFLDTLSCASCGLQGQVPAQITSMTNLSWLDLHNNELTGEIPKDIGNLVKLQSLDLSYNGLTGALPDMTALGNVSTLKLNNNDLTGGITNGFVKSANLVWLHSNRFSAEIPSIGGLNFTDLRLQDNRLNGSIPSQLFNLSLSTRMVAIDLSRNSFGGGFPPSIGSLGGKLRSLRLSYCGLTGPLNKSFVQNLTALRYLDLSYNGFSASLPSLKNLTSLLQLNLANNGFTTTNLSVVLPDANLEKLDVSGLGLALKGLPIFPQKYNTSLVSLSLQANFISGVLTAADFNKFEKLQAVFLQNNEFSGEVSSIANISRSSHIEFVDLKSNQVSTLRVGAPAVSNGSRVDLNLAYNPVCTSNASLSFCKGDAGRASSYNHTDCTICLYGNNKPRPTDCTCAGYFEANFTFVDSPLAYISNRSMAELGAFLGDKTDKAVLVHVANATLSATLTYIVWFFSMDTLDIDVSYRHKLLRIPDGEHVAGIGSIDHFSVSRVIPFVPPPPPPPLPPPPPPNSTKTDDTVLIASTSASAGVFLFIALALFIYLCCLRESESTLEIKVGEGFVKAIPLPDVRKATNNFDEASLLGVGGYGFVYKGLAPNGEVWAVKRAKSISLKGLKEFEQEVATISKLSHTNIVKLLGFCDRKNEQILIYEFMANGSLRHKLRPDNEEDAPALTFEQRVDIAVGAAEGLLYLHKYAHTALIHRDIKSDNILLDQNLTAKVADFGLVKDNPTGSAEDALKTRVAGTPGYIDPEYFTNYQVTAKSDVYSFGVVLLELITARSALIKEEVSAEPDFPTLTTLPNWVQPYLSNIAPIVDPRMGPYDELAMAMLVKLASVCIERAGCYRPNMEEVARRLGQIKNVVLGVSETEDTQLQMQTDDYTSLSDASMMRVQVEDLNPLAPISQSYGGR